MNGAPRFPGTRFAFFMPQRYPIRVARGLLGLCLAGSGYFSPAVAAVDTWSSTGPYGVPVTALALDPRVSGHLYAGFAGHGVYVTCDHGATWNAMNDGLGEIYIDALLVDPVRANTVYAASPNRGLFKSVDGGRSWASLGGRDLPDRSAHHLAIDPRVGTLFVSTDAGVFRSYDGGDSWQSTRLRIGVEEIGASQPSLGGWIDCLAFDSHAAALYACFFDWGAEPGLSWQLLRSADAGVTWHPVPLPGGGGPLAMTVAENGLYVVMYDPYAPSSAILESSASCPGWHAVAADMPGCGADCRFNGYAAGSDPTAPAYAATDRGVYRRGGGDASWQALAVGMGDRVVTDVVVDGRFVYAATGDGVFTMEVGAPACAGDCDADGIVTVAELVTMVEIGMERRPPEACTPGDGDGDGITVADLVTAVASALHGCEAP